MRAYSPTLKKEIDIPDEIYQQSLIRRQQAQQIQGTAPSGSTSMMDSYMPTQQPTQQQLDPNKVMRLLMDPNVPSKVKTGIEKAYAIQQDEMKKTQPTDEEQKKIAAKAETEQVLKLLEELYLGKEGEQPLAFAKEQPLGRQLPVWSKQLQQKLNPGSFPESERMMAYERTLKSKRPQLAKAAGDVGNLAVQEQIQAGKGLPDFGMTPEEAVLLLKSFREGFGLQPGEQVTGFEGRIQQQPQQPQGQRGLPGMLLKGGGAVADFVAPNTKDLAQRVTTPGYQISKFTPEESAAAKGNLGKSAQLAVRSMGDLAGQIAAPGVELALLLGGGKLIKAGGNKLFGAGAGKAATKSGGGLLNKLFRPKAGLQAAGKAQEQAAKAAGEVSKESLVKALGTSDKPNMKLLEGVGTAAEKKELVGLLKAEIQDLIRPLGKNPTVLELLKKRQGLETATKWAQGTVQSSKNKLYKNIYTAFNQVLDDVPEVRKIDRLLQELMKSQAKQEALKKGVGSFFGKSLPWVIGTAAGGTIGVTIARNAMQSGEEGL